MKVLWNDSLVTAVRMSDDFKLVLRCWFFDAACEAATRKDEPVNLLGADDDPDWYGSPEARYAVLDRPRTHMMIGMGCC